MNERTAFKQFLRRNPSKQSLLSCLTFQILKCSFDEIIMISMTTSAKMMKTRRQLMNLKIFSQMMAQATQQSLLMTHLRTSVRMIKRRMIQKTMRTAQNIQFSKNASLSRRNTLEMILNLQACHNQLQVYFLKQTLKHLTWTLSLNKL